MYIQPNSTILLCKDVPLDTTYNHTLYFDNAGLQIAYFRSKTKTTFNANSYQRVVRGKMRVQACADDIYDCNYLCFQNTNFGNKWFYAFITSIEYVNNITSEITFKMDVMQTYLFDVELKECFVEREHVSDDTIGLHTLPEKVEVGECLPMKLCHHMFGTETVRKWKARITVKPNAVAHVVRELSDAIAGAFQPTPDAWDLQEGENQLGLPIFSADLNDATGIQNFLNAASMLQQEVTDITMYPAYFENQAHITIDPDQFDVKRPTKFDMPDIQGLHSYTPKNNKLLTYPYTYLLVDNNDGARKTFKWEDFYSGGTTVQFFLQHNLMNEVGCFIECRTYENGNVKNTRLWLTNFPKIQLSSGNLLQPLENILGTMAFAAGGEAIGMPPVTMIPSEMSYNEARDVIAEQGMVKDTLPNVGHELAQNAFSLELTASNSVGQRNRNTQLKYNEIGFSFYQMGIKPEYAKIIDEYFNVRGYRVDTVKVPNRAVRQHWTYCKTRGCVVRNNPTTGGGAPADDLAEICRCYDNGITFWRSPEYVGNYSLSNPIIV